MQLLVRSDYRSDISKHILSSVLCKVLSDHFELIVSRRRLQCPGNAFTQEDKETNWVVTPGAYLRCVRLWGFVLSIIFVLEQY